jgi:hypothetical protein
MTETGRSAGCQGEICSTLVKIDILDMLTDPTNQRAWLQHHSTVARHVEYQLVED